MSQLTVMLRKLMPINNRRHDHLTLRHKYFVIGALLLVVYSMQLVLGIRLELLVFLQESEIYKQTTGFLLLGVLAFQFWLVVSRRMTDDVTKKRRLLLHKWLGVGVLIALFVHSISLGYAYQSVLVIVFLLNVCVGMCNSDIIRLKGVAYKIWIIMHVSLANITMALVFYHIYITYKFS